MILTLAAAGAFLSSFEAIQRLEYAIMEVARLLVNAKVWATCKDNNQTRVLHYMLTVLGAQRKPESSREVLMESYSR